MGNFFRFLRLPMPGLAPQGRTGIAALGAAGLLAVAIWLAHNSWPATLDASSDLFILPLALMAFSLGLSGAIVGSLIVTLVLFWIGAEHLSAEDIVQRSGYITVVTLVLAAFAHLQGYYQRRLFHVMTHDQGTRLPNRLALWRALDQQLRERQAGVPRNALLVITLDNLHDVVATFGYDAADHLIVQLWQHLVDAFAPGARVYHYRYERLAVLFHDPDDNPDALMRGLATRLETSILYQDVPIHFTSLFGFVRLNGNDGRQVINQAEAAIETARERDLQGLIYSSSMDRERKRGLILLGDLQTAKGDGSLTMHYQPKVRLSDMQLASFEALARWQHATLGSISPSEFIPIVERTELIHSFSVWAVEHMFIAMREHWPQGQAQLPVAVNVSSHNLMNPIFPKQIRALLDKYGLPPSLLELEVTESEIMQNPEQAIIVLEQLADIQIVISIDDFGTGYSSLAYLHRLPATMIKIDRAFIDKMNKSSGVRHIVSAAIDLAHMLEMKVIAEGIETIDQLETLRQLGCDYGQGYLFSPAMAIGDAACWRLDPEHCSDGLDQLAKATAKQCTEGRPGL